MTKRELYNFQKRLEREKYDFVGSDIAFSFAIRENSETIHVGAGAGKELAILTLAQLLDLYLFGVQDKKRVTPECFAESIKEQLIRYMKAHI